MPTRVKICGLTRPEDAALAAELGADAIGLNFIAGPRKLRFEQALNISSQVPPLVSIVSLLPGPPIPIPDGRHGPTFDLTFGLGRIDQACDVLRYTDYAQLYYIPEAMKEVIIKWGASDLVELNKYWPVFPIATRESILNAQKELAANQLYPLAVVFDTAVKGQLGGTGQSFNWNWIAEAREAGELKDLPPIILAGGLTPDNVAEAIRIAKPYAVDVSSGVEPPNQPGIKDPIKMRDFIQAAKSG